MYNKIIVLMFIISITLAGSVFGGTATTTGWKGVDGGDWNNAANWSNGIPLQNDPAGGPQAASYGKAAFKFPLYGSNGLNSPGITTGVEVGADQIAVGGTTSGKLTIDGGTINVSEWVRVGDSSVGPEKGTLNMISGTLNCGTRISTSGQLYVGYSGLGTVNMNGGTINLTDNLVIQNSSTQASYLHFDGGTINAAGLVMTGANGHLDIRAGTLILDGDDTAVVDGYVTSGKLTAYAGEGGVVQRDYNVTNAGKTTVTGYLPSPKAINPAPFMNATNVSINPTLSWTVGMGATSHDVYFGTTASPAFVGNQAAATYSPSTLIPNTMYYWRIDEVSGTGTTTGDVWRFTTIGGQPSSPNPATLSSGVPISPTLSWTPGADSPLHDVYFGTSSSSLVLVSDNQSESAYNTGNLESGKLYFWQIQEVYSTGTIAGPVWSFTVANTKATINPNQYGPRDGAVHMPTTKIVLSWNAGQGAATHDVYFGTTNPPAFQQNQTALTFPLSGVLANNTTYYWQIDAKDETGGTTAGDVWSFTTGGPVGIYPYLTWRGDPTTTITVNWWNPVALGDTSVDYGLTASYGSVVTDANSTNYHHITITGLTPSTTYYYRIRSSDGTVGEDNTFVTGTVNPTSFSFVYTGDPRSTEFEDEPYLTRQKALCDWAAQQDIAFYIEGGDTVWDGTSLVSFGKYWPDFFKAQRDLTKTKVVMHTLGNHEVQGGGSYYYWNDFYKDAHPTNAEPSSNGRLYSFDYGNAHFVSCASYQVNWEVEKTWLRADLTAAKARGAKWIFAYMHFPLYTTSGHAPRQPDMAALGPIFDEFGVAIAFGSHNHVYERFTPIITYFDNVTNPTTPVWTGRIVPNGEGTVYITNGIGGAEFNNSAADPKLVSWFGAGNVNTTVATKVTISGDYCLLQAIRNDTGEVLDSYQVLPRLRKDDFNRDGITDIKDLGTMTDNWLGTGIWP